MSLALYLSHVRSNEVLGVSICASGVAPNALAQH